MRDERRVCYPVADHFLAQSGRMSSISVIHSNRLLVGGLERDFYDFPYIGNVITPTDFHIFHRGSYTTNQIIYIYPICALLLCICTLSQLIAWEDFPSPQPDDGKYVDPTILRVSSIGLDAKAGSGSMPCGSKYLLRPCLGYKQKVAKYLLRKYYADHI